MDEPSFHDALKRMSERGTPRGARAVVDAAITEAAGPAATGDPRNPAATLPPVAAPAGAAAATEPQAQHPPHRRWPRRLLIGLNVFVALCIVAAGSGYLYLRWRFSQINTVSFADGVLSDENAGEPMNVLMVGSDTRANLTGADCKRNCVDENGRRVTGQRSDTIMILHADPQAGRGAILSIPRDLWVPIAGTNRNQRINTAFEKGPGVLVQTITNALGIQIDHYVEVDFVGFRSLVNAVGGVPIYVPAPARDRYSDLNIPNPGCITLSGDQALGWVRSRHYQYYESGRWRSDPRSDFGRILRQQDFIRRLMKRAISKGIRNPLTLNRMVGIATKNLTIDDAMSSKDIFRLGKQFRSLDPESVQMYTLPVSNARIGGADVLKIKQPDAQQLIAQFNNQTPSGGEQPPAGLLPASVRVRVLNGSGIGGLAGKTATSLSSFGFQDVATGDADSFKYTKTVVKYGKGQRDKALLLRSFLPAGAELQEDTTLTVDAVLILGRDFAGVAKPAAPGATATTAAPATTSPPTTQSPVPVPKGAPQQPQC
jgi:LCP family protein required for cell wall assembly